MCTVETAESREPAGAPVDEIEVTPDMIDAGVLAFFDVDRRFDGIEVAVEHAFLAMCEQRRARVK
jgi:hypothetical protein